METCVIKRDFTLNCESGKHHVCLQVTLPPFPLDGSIGRWHLLLLLTPLLSLGYWLGGWSQTWDSGFWLLLPVNGGQQTHKEGTVY